MAEIVEQKYPATIQNDNKAVRDTPKLSKSRSAVLNLFVQQASFSSAIAVQILHNREGFHTQGRLLHKLVSSLYDSGLGLGLGLLVAINW